MQIKEAKIFNFGKLQNTTFSFSRGINVIYGANEQGKTTLHTFLTGMLFGMEKGRGRVASGDVYTRYEPWHAPSFYSGALRFCVDEKPFYLERNFYNKEKSEYLRNEADGEELSVTYGDLDMLLGGIGREEFGNTYDIPQTGAATGKAMSDLLSAYLAEAAAGGNGKVHVRKAQKDLASRKKEKLVDQKRLREAREQKIQQKRIELEVLQENAATLKTQIHTFEEEQKQLEYKLLEKEQNWKNRWRWWILCGLLLLFVIVGTLVFFNVLPVEACIVIGAVELITGVLLLLPRKDNDRELFEHAREMLAQIKENLQENENEIINLEEIIEELQTVSIEERLLLEDVTALELAQVQIEKISEEYYLEVSDELNAELSKWISMLTNEAYDSARLDREGKLWIVAEDREVLPESLSRGTLEQIYLALRLAVGSILVQEEELPIFLDEAFAMYDDVRLAQTLKALAQTGKQIFIFTCQKREAAILEQEGIGYHMVKMSE